MAINRKHVGSSFDDFLQEEGILEECKAVANNRVEEHKKTLAQSRVTKTAPKPKGHVNALRTRQLVTA